MDATTRRCTIIILLLLAFAITPACSDTTTPTPACQYTVSPASFTPCMRATTLTATVTTQASCSWSASSDASWLVPAGTVSGSGAGTITFAVGDNWDAPRHGTVSVRGAAAVQTQTVSVSQAGCYYAVTRASFAFAAAGGSDSFDVVQQSDPNTCGGALQDACVWTAQSDSTWITITSSMPRQGDQQVRFTVAANTSGAARSGQITVRDKAVQITQAAS